MKNELITQPETNIPNTLRTLANAIESGQIKHYEFNQNSDGFTTVKVDSSDGEQRMIKTQQEQDGYSKVSTEYIKKQTPESRRHIVLNLVNEGLSQTQIAEKTMVSQKTVSNDIKILKESNKLYQR
jgi:DNA-binding NarL/FixJ family response regulator